jgi:A/G-specific adenine glycosylase
MPLLDPRTRASLRRRLSAWYAAEARDLPWRRTRDPYGIWISEAMLQQTRVETVLEYWPRFLDRFPTLADLAAAEEDAVLARWSGLGYYRRARSLHAAARTIVGEHGGRFPRDHAAALDLPGVGPYTAAAVLSIAFDACLPLVDGNVERVLARYFLLEHPAGSGALERETWALAGALVPERGAGAWNQALMELGSTVCTPRAVRCGACPLARGCRARRTGRVSELPLPKPKPRTIEVELELAWISDSAGRVLLERRPRTGRMAGLWQLPTVELTASGLFPRVWAAPVELRDPVASLRHAITRHRIRAALRPAGLGGSPPPAWRWAGATQLGDLALTGMTKKALSTLQPPG